MKTFMCSCTGNPALFFESNSCYNCGRVVGITDNFQLVQPFNFDQLTGNYFLDNSDDIQYKKCQNFLNYQACNGMIQVGATDEKGALINYCFSCRYNDTIPNLSIRGHLPLWIKMENAKRRALYTLKALSLPLQNIYQDPFYGITFTFGVDSDVNDHFKTRLHNGPAITTGHNCGHITINLAEADDVARSKIKMDMGENYRTLLGHFRHEFGHYYFDVLIADNTYNYNMYKDCFNDVGQDYTMAQNDYYKYSSPENWQQEYISEYATMHPWEDWAETWAHYMHIVDTLETAQHYGLKPSRMGAVNSQRSHGVEQFQEVDFFTFHPNFDFILDVWIEFSVILNSLNRSMGLQDAYPFVLTPTVRKKLKFVHFAIYNQLNQLNFNEVG